MSSEKFKHFIFLQTKEATIFGRKGVKIIGIYFEGITERTSISEKIEEKSLLSLNIPNNKSYYWHDSCVFLLFSSNLKWKLNALENGEQLHFHCKSCTFHGNDGLMVRGWETPLNFRLIPEEIKAICILIKDNNEFERIKNLLGGNDNVEKKLICVKNLKEEEITFKEYKQKMLLRINIKEELNIEVTEIEKRGLMQNEFFRYFLVAIIAGILGEASKLFWKRQRNSRKKWTKSQVRE